MNISLASCLAAVLLAAASTAFCADAAPKTDANGPQPIAIWPGDAPGEKGDMGPEVDKTKPDQREKGIIILGNVSKPTIAIYRPDKDKATGAAVLVCPGGGYSILATEHEGVAVCQWLNSFGVTGVLLKYRVPARKGLEKYTAALQDAQRAMGIVRQRAGEWGIDANHVGVLGFSAGGHLSAALSTNYDKRTYEAVDDADKLSCRPDFALLIYPAYLVQKDKGFAISPELKITSNTPPTFLMQTEDDPIGVECCLFYYLALKTAKVPAEMHLYAKGGHGYGLKGSNAPLAGWPDRAREWIQSLLAQAKK